MRENILKTLFAIVFSTTFTTAQASNSQTEPQTIENAFLTALSHLKADKPEKAIQIYLAILAHNPSLVRVRLELARAYFAAENWNKARQEFFLVLSADLPDPVKDRVLKYIREIDSRRGFDWNLSLSLVSVGNQRKYDGDTVYINANGTLIPFVYDREIVNETGIRANGSLNFRQALKGLSSANTSVNFFSTLSFDITEAERTIYDDLSLSLSAGMRTVGKNTTYSLAPVAKTRWVGSKHYEDKFGLHGVFERRSLMGGSAFGSLSYFDINNEFDENLSGASSSGSIGYRKSFGGRAILGVSAQVERKKVLNSLEDAQTSQITAFGTFELMGGITAYPSIYYRYKDVKNPSSAMVGNPDQRSTGARLKIEKSDWFLAGGYTPFVELSYEDTRSDISAFSYTEGRVQIGLTRRY